MKSLNSFLILALSLFTISVFAQENVSGPTAKKQGGHCGKLSPEIKAQLKAERVRFDDRLSNEEKQQLSTARAEWKVFMKERMRLDKSTMTKTDWEELKVEKRKILTPVKTIAVTHKEELWSILKKVHSDKAIKGKEGHCKDKGDWDKKDKDKLDAKDYCIELKQKMGAVEKGSKDYAAMMELYKLKCGADKGDKKDPGKGKGDWNKDKEKLDKDKYDKGKCDDQSKGCSEKGDYFMMRFLLMEPNENKATIKVYPNPSVHYNTITFNHVSDGMIIIDLLDKEGKVIKQVMNEYKDAGVINASFDVTGLETGNLYFYRISDNGTVTNKKFILSAE